MQATMPRNRITIDCEEAHKRAFLAWASLEGLSSQDLFERMVEQLCPPDVLKRAKDSVPADDEEEEKGRRGRKPRA